MLSLTVAVTWLRLPEVSAGKAQHSCHAANPPQVSGGHLPPALTLLRGSRFIIWCLSYLF